jgi:hypothetical protein
MSESIHRHPGRAVLFVKFRTACAVAALAFMLAACDMVSQVKDGMAHSSAVAESIQKQVGTRPEVGFNYNNGSFTRASVQFAEVPAMPLPELEKVVRAAVVREFKEEPSSLVISFSYAKGK